jgi:hypothetical protein
LDEPRTIGPFEKPNVFGSPHPKEKYYDYNQAIIGGIDRCCHARNTRHGSRELRSPTAPLSPPPTILTGMSAFQRRASAHCRRRRTGKIATSAITRSYAEKATRRNGPVRLVERSSGALRIRRTVIGTPHGVSNVEGIEAITE